MAITRIGSIDTSFISEDNAGSTSITVPVDAEILIVGVCGYDSTLTYFSNGTMTIGGAGNPMTVVPSGTGDFMNSALFYRVLPPTGSQTLAWDWDGASVADVGIQFLIGSYKGINTGGGASTVRDTDGKQDAAAPITSKDLTAQTGDMIISLFASFNPSATYTITWAGSGATPSGIADVQDFDVACGWAETSPTGNQTITADETVDHGDDSMVALVLIPASGDGGGGGSMSINRKAMRPNAFVPGLAR